MFSKSKIKKFWLAPAAYGKAAAVGGVTTLNPSDHTATVLTLSNGNKTFAVTSSGGVRSVASYSTGKKYFEMLCQGTTGNSFDDVIGIANSSWNLATPVFLGSDTNSGSWASSDTRFVINNVQVGGTIGTFQAFLGDTACVAVDFGAQLIWFRPNGGDWNGSPTNNPATATGGLSFSSITGPYFAAFYGNSNGVAATVTFDTSLAAFTVPSGFSSM